VTARQEALSASHEIRREEVAEAAARLVTRAGLEKVTVREVAIELGYSTAVVSHYFKNKKDLLLHTYGAAAQRSLVRFEAARAATPNNLQACLEVFLPLDEARRRDWRVWLAFWGMAIGDPDFCAEQRRQVLEARGGIKHVLETLNASKRPAAARAARGLLTAIMGIAVQAIFDPEDWSVPDQRSVLSEAIDHWTAGEARERA
jgi:AcrR family transcriptional regulator